MGAILKGAKNALPAADSEGGQSTAIYSDPNVFFYFLEMMSLAQLREMFLISKSVRELSVEKLRGLVLLVGERGRRGIDSAVGGSGGVWSGREPFWEGAVVQKGGRRQGAEGKDGRGGSGAGGMEGGMVAPPNRTKQKDAVETLLFSSILSEIEEFEGSTAKKKIAEKLAEVYEKERLTPELLPTALLIIEEEMAFGGLRGKDFFGSGPPGASAEAARAGKGADVQTVKANKDGSVVFAPVRQMLYHYLGRNPESMEKLVMGIAKSRGGGETAEEIRKMRKALGREKFAKEMAMRLKGKEFDDFCMFADRARKRVYVCRMFCTKAVLKKAFALSKRLFG